MKLAKLAKWHSLAGWYVLRDRDTGVFLYDANVDGSGIIGGPNVENISVFSATDAKFLAEKFSGVWDVERADSRFGLYYELSEKLKLSVKVDDIGLANGPLKKFLAGELKEKAREVKDIANSIQKTIKDYKDELRQELKHFNNDILEQKADLAASKADAQKIYALMKAECDLPAKRKKKKVAKK